VLFFFFYSLLLFAVRVSETLKILNLIILEDMNDSTCENCYCFHLSFQDVVLLLIFYIVH